MTGVRVSAFGCTCKCMGSGFWSRFVLYKDVRLVTVPGEIARPVLVTYLLTTVSNYNTTVHRTIRESILTV